MCAQKEAEEAHTTEIQTSEVREEVLSSFSWTFKASGVASKTFYSSGVDCFLFFLFGRGKELISKVRGK